MVSPALAVPPGYFLECDVVNASSSPRTIRIRGFDSNGTVQSSNGPITINPNGVGGVSIPYGAGVVLFEIVGDGKGSFYRPSIKLLAPDGSGEKLALPISTEDAPQ